MVRVICENDYCIYWSKEACTLNEIELNEIGLCACGILVKIDEDELKIKRKRLLDGLKEH
ncbi:hypothetical protein LJC10_02685 [Selenomonadales bacterium OttesenSCG-928-I06]|nr:hypothetical protein [Selenomonadales bacterium OttesenSCG-928-I06]